ncbi:SoxY-related AACIE arm protein [uncultured Alsobacter sp.]|uniref:SoxY-related AACIE arm protein n=1 Tax=uncultured Alsobacter sp. TaxID=1748258 RepID=UPI0025DEFAE2|nr:SoxY-related AACIE arm protein [uncultured Alsobacter sp.]
MIASRKSLLTPNRRGLLAAGGGLVGLLALRPAHATASAMQEAMKAFCAGVTPQAGRVTLDIPPLVENGNSVPLTVRVEAAMTAQEHVRRIGVFNERNPQPNIAVFHLNARSGRAEVATRIRLGDSQIIAAIAELSDGSLWTATAELVVTLPACVES